ncbi:hypothetical protein Sgly_1051 [Syntrophobotulus glycolicus DSM 8271]|uniref:DUF4180 domain-containing protein n=1 Tax=Syntrophobotulus glycolicus (strain DSM 8271 / FlGlyR) TaxID=645991 RepID=F0STU0_SYNGF|nr:DUF4180 domain-containing protein [Syntrophobotulus glycolicus]ADY55380.1 hypothetical protein Sgly_1051 [Syntrophobotulus glycolicus DSM 8271]
MKTKIIDGIAVMNSTEPLITDGQSALDLTATVYYEQGVTKMVVNKEAISEDFFKLSTGFAGEVVQKFVNYHFSVAIVGDFSKYTSKPLRDYMYECNNGKHLFFVTTEQEAIEKLR